jgi:hypothetical protein
MHRIAFGIPILVAAAFASVCVLGEVIGCAAVLLLGIAALACLKRDAAAPVVASNSANSLNSLRGLRASFCLLAA